MIKEPKSKFIKVRCKCKNEQIIFEKCSTKVDCLVCGKPLAVPQGGKAKIEARVLEVLS
ncbi:30S ribosomal protein S27e [archaeon]|jgi:small subunit ribosomal protein S27e|nr:30S ribosomal protein S27e [archaeon]MBT4417192.1 30S ribosomal protein S27e [archaeon]